MKLYLVSVNKAKVFCRLLIDEVLYNGHIMAFSGVMSAFFTLLILDKRIDILGLISLYFIIQPIYFLDRVLYFEKDSLGNSVRSEHVKKVQNIIPLLMFGYCIVFTLLTLGIGKVENFVFGLIVIAIGVLYGLVFKKFTKYIIGFKNIFVGIFWVCFSIYIMIYIKEQIININFLLVALFILLKTIYIQIFFDLKDIASDREDKLKTIPVLFGEKRTFSILNIVAIISFLPIILGLFLGSFKMLESVLLADIVYMLLITNSYRKNRNYIHFIYLGIDYIVLLIIQLIISNAY